MHTNWDFGEKPALLLKEEVFRIVGCAMEVLNGLGHGLHEKIYENALVVEFDANRIPFQQQKPFPVVYKNANIGSFIPDLLAFGAVIVEVKVIDKITDHERGQVLNYLRVTQLRVGLLLNFKNRKLEWERIVL